MGPQRVPQHAQLITALLGFMLWAGAGATLLVLGLHRHWLQPAGAAKPAAHVFVLAKWKLGSLGRPAGLCDSLGRGLSYRDSRAGVFWRRSAMALLLRRRAAACAGAGSSGDSLDGWRVLLAAVSPAGWPVVWRCRSIAPRPLRFDARWAIDRYARMLQGATGQRSISGCAKHSQPSCADRSCEWPGMVDLAYVTVA